MAFPGSQNLGWVDLATAVSSRIFLLSDTRGFCSFWVVWSNACLWRRGLDPSTVVWQHEGYCLIASGSTMASTSSCWAPHIPVESWHDPWHSPVWTIQAASSPIQLPHVPPPSPASWVPPACWHFARDKIKVRIMIARPLPFRNLLVVPDLASVPQSICLHCFNEHAHYLLLC